jgi:hypothetical protein
MNRLPFEADKRPFEDGDIGLKRLFFPVDRGLSGRNQKQYRKQCHYRYIFTFEYLLLLKQKLL